MATWQFDSIVVPREPILKKFLVIPPKLDMEEFSAVNWWGEINLTKTLIHSIIPFSGTQKKMFTPTLEMWGSEDGNRIDIVYSKKDKVEGISVRFDAREISEKFIMDLIVFLKELDCLMITEANIVIDPKVVQQKGPNFFFSLLNQINDSKAKNFVDNPEDFFRNLDKDDNP